MDLINLPLELFIEILNKTDGCTLGKCRRVSKQWKNVIDSTEVLWSKACENEFKYSSKIAKRKVGSDCSWYHIFKNLYKWMYSSVPEQSVKEFYKFTSHDKRLALEIESGILPLRDSRGLVLHDMNTLKVIPLPILCKNCLKMSNNDYATALQLKHGLLIQRNKRTESKISTLFVRADNFILLDNYVYYINKRDVFKCDLRNENLTSELVLHSKMEIKEMQIDSNSIYVFTECGNLITVKGKTISTKPINCPPDWIRQIKHINAINDNNFICYSRNLFKIETDYHEHLYLDFPQITALFFYSEIVLIGIKNGEILLYKLSSQKKDMKPVFETLAVLPDGKFAVHLDVYEKKSGPVIVAATFFEIFLIEMIFFPYETENRTNVSTSKLNMYKRLLKIKKIINDKECNLMLENC